MFVICILALIVASCSTMQTAATETSPAPSETPAAPPAPEVIIQTVVVEVPVEVQVEVPVEVPVEVHQVACDTINDGILNEYAMVGPDDLNMSVIVESMPEPGCAGYMLVKTTTTGQWYNKTPGKKLAIWLGIDWDQLMIQELPEGVIRMGGDGPLTRYVTAKEYFETHELGMQFDNNERFSGIPYFEITFIATTNAGSLIGLTLRENVDWRTNNN